MNDALRIEEDRAAIQVSFGALHGRTSMEFHLRPQDQEDLRWYLEDYVSYPIEPAPSIAAQIERQMVEWGAALFNAVFPTAELREIWSRAARSLAELQIEIVSTDPAIPWELMRPTAEAYPLGLAARSFVRVPQSAAIDTPPIPGPASEGTLRVLLVICRPEGSADVPFRAVASRIVETLDIGACDVLRPPTLENLSETLAARRKAGRPYDVVHFDGHGVFLDLKAEQMGVLSDPTRMRGYLVFETGDGGSEYVNGSVIGQILQENQTPILVLNACRSARAQPRPAAAQNASVQPLVFQSLSQEAMSFQLSGIVAMRFNVYVPTAARLMERLYGGLSAGKLLGDAVADARRGLDSSPIQDWFVLEVLERQPWRKARDAARPATPELRPASEPMPAGAGFWGRDYGLLRLDRAFDRYAVILLHGYIGGGKTTAAREFVRWYQSTGGTDGPVAFASSKALPGDPAALCVLDAVDQIDPAQRGALLALIKAVSTAGRKLLLISRSPETDWLSGDAAHRILLGPITPQGCVELIDHWVRRNSAALASAVFAPFVQYSHGNPQVLYALLAEAARAGVASRPESERLIEQMQLGQRKPERIPPSLLEALSTFSPSEQEKLSVLGVFQQLVSAGLFTAVCGAGVDLLGRAVFKGLLADLGHEYFAIHPAMWMLQGDNPPLAAFVSAYVSVAKTFNNEMARGNNAVLQHYGLHEANAKHAMRLAELRDDWESEFEIANGQLTFLQIGHRDVEFRNLVATLEPLILDRPGREKYFASLWERQSLSAEMAGDLAQAEGLLGKAIEHTRPRIPAEDAGLQDPDGNAVGLISQLAMEIYRRAQIREALRNALCLGDYLEAIGLNQRIGSEAAAANCALDLGTACLRLGNDLKTAEQSYQWALQLFGERDLLGKAKCYLQLASVSLQRFESAEDEQTAKDALRASFDYSSHALAMLPDNATEERAACFARLGTTSRYAGDTANGLEYAQKALAIYDAGGKTAEAAMMRLNIASLLIEQNRCEKSAEYLRHAVKQYRSLGAAGAVGLRDAEARLAWVEGRLQQQTESAPG